MLTQEWPMHTENTLFSFFGADLSAPSTSHFSKMAITELNAPGNASVATVHEASKAKILFIALLFLLSLASFICQTEFTSRAYALGFQEPIILLTVTHGLWWILWPIQAFIVSIFRTSQRVRRGDKGYLRLNSNAFLLDPDVGRDVGREVGRESGRLPPAHDQAPQQIAKPLNVLKYFKKCIVKQFHNVYHTLILVYEANVNGDRLKHHLNALVELNPHISSSSSITACVKSFVSTPSFKYIAVKVGILSIVLNVAGLTWYAAMAMTYASDVTAIYNCSAFTAYAFAIPILNEKFSWLKASSVLIAVSGVFVVAFSGADSPLAGEEQYPYRIWGNLLISAGAVMYGYYEVLYKRYTCVPEHLSKVITPRRQLTFSNFVMCLVGLYSLVILGAGVIIAEVFQIHHFNLFNYGEETGTIWLSIVASIISNLIFSASFLSLMALTSPVLSSVSSLTTIFLIGVVEWVLFGNALSSAQLVGDALVIIGFVILTVASWKEISEGNEDDEIETASFYSFAASENTINN